MNVLSVSNRPNHHGKFPFENGCVPQTIISVIFPYKCVKCVSFLANLSTSGHFCAHFEQPIDKYSTEYH